MSSGYQGRDREASKQQSNLSFLLGNKQLKELCSKILAAADPVKIAETSSAPPALSPVPPISQDEFQNIPKYMKGRLTQEKINQGIEYFSRVLHERYSLLRQNPAKLNVETRHRWYELREAECEEVAGRYFVTEQDLKGPATGGKGNNTSAAFKMDATGRAILAIMRHVGRIKEVRSNGLARFVLICQ